MYVAVGVSVCVHMLSMLVWVLMSVRWYILYVSVGVLVCVAVGVLVYTVCCCGCVGVQRLQPWLSAFSIFLPYFSILIAISVFSHKPFPYFHISHFRIFT